ncbi:MAG: hypothetical protein RSG53_00905 [Oscillospiraceae bacterium]
MTRSEYLSELRSRLSRLPEDDLNEAIEFYTEYFEDAQSDADAVSALGSPARLAAQLNAEFSAQSLSQKSASLYRLSTEPAPDISGLVSDMPANSFPNYIQDESEAKRTASKQADTALPPDFTSSGYTRGTYSSVYGQAGAPVSPVTPPLENGGNNPKAYSPQSPYTTEEGRKSSLSAIWYVILGIFALPVALPLAGIAIAIIVLLLAVCFALIVSFFAVIAALIGGSAISLIGFVTHGAGFVSFGASLVMFGLALTLIPLLMLFTVWLVRTVGKLCAKLFNKLKARSIKK